MTGSPGIAGDGVPMPRPDPTGASTTVLRARDVRIQIPTSQGVVTAVDGVSLELRAGEVLGIVGETGSGKTVSCRSLLGLLPSTRATHEGSVTYPEVSDVNVLQLKRKQLRRYWGKYVSMIPQNPMTSLNPVHRIGHQIDEAVGAHSTMSREQRHARTIELMTRVGIPVPERRVRDYPHQFSGGMLQRTLIAIALAGEPRILVADEPTTALDTIIQDQILDLLIRLQRDTAMSLILVSHDLSVISQICDRVAVMYAGQIVELADTDDIIRRPQHPYTAALLKAMPGEADRDRPLTTIAGSPPRLVGLPATCRFMPRCDYAEAVCEEWNTTLLPAETSGGQPQVRCVRHGEIDLSINTSGMADARPAWPAGVMPVRDR